MLHTHVLQRCIVKNRSKCSRSDPGVEQYTCGMPDSTTTYCTVNQTVYACSETGRVYT